MSSIYTRIDPSRKEVRVISLQPGKWDDEIRCLLHVVSLDDELDYAALSYVWGDPAQSKK